MKQGVRFASAVAIALALAAGSASVSNAQPTSLEVSIVPMALECGGGASFVFVGARDEAGTLVDAGTVSFAASMGSIATQVSDADHDGSVVTTLQAPADSAGIVVVTASSSFGPIGTASAVVTCKPAAKDLCQEGGWQTATRADGSGFKNQGDCIQYFSKGK
jgi:hypothetical protein